MPVGTSPVEARDARLDSRAGHPHGVPSLIFFLMGRIPGHFKPDLDRLQSHCHACELRMALSTHHWMPSRGHEDDVNERRCHGGTLTVPYGLGV